MAQGLKTYAGMAVPLYGESTIFGKTAADDTLTIQQVAAHAGSPLVVKNSASTNVWGINSLGALRTMVLSTVAIASCNSSSTVTATLTGATTADIVSLWPTAGYVTGNGTLYAICTAADKITVYAAGLSVAATTCNVQLIRTV
jgi:hypothetical protein